VIKDREQLAALNPYSSTMLLSTLHWPDEVRSLADLELPEEQFEFKPAEKKMAEQLVSAMTGEFHAEEYRDDYRQALMAVIEAKIGGQPAVRPQAPREDSKLVDLMSALEQSVAAARQGRSAGGADKADGGAPEAAAGAPTSMTAARRSRATKQPAGGSRTAARKVPAEREADVPAQKPQRKRKSA
jgi:DNA end-binding protein Ku